MTTDRTIKLPPDLLALKIATAEAVRAAGGQDFVADQVGRTQSVISDYCSRTTRSFMPIDIAQKVEALGTGYAGAPHVTRALARAHGIAVDMPCAAAGDDFDLGDWMARLARESADVLDCLAQEDLSDRVHSMSVTARELLGRELDQFSQVIEQLRGALARRDSS